MRPTGRLHLGHYHGVLKNWVRLQHEYDCHFFVADWHALTTHYEDPEVIYSPQGQETRDKAKITTDIKQNIYLDGRLGLIIDGTGRNEAKIAKAKEKLVKMGYSCMMLFVNTSLEVAQERNVSRPGRTIKPEEVEKMWRDVQDNIMKFQQLFGADKFQVIDNNGGLEDPTRKENFDVVAKNIDKFVNRPPSNRRAKEWIEDQKSKKNTTNQDNQ